MRNSRWRLLLVCVAIGFFFNSIKTSAQTLKPFQKGTTSAPLGYYEYLPAGYSPTDAKKWPIIIFLHGVGEVGDGTSQLSIILRTGLPLVLQNGKSLPFIIIMPQANQQWWDPAQVDQMYEFAKTKYNVDQNRFYMTGLSLGGIGTWLYTMAYPQKVAAMISCSGNSGGHYSSEICAMNNIPIWDFHGDADQTVKTQDDIDAVNAINNLCKTSPRAKLTIYTGVGHNCWDETYNGSGFNASNVSKSYDPYDMDIFAWLLQYAKNGVTIQANAGADKSTTLPANSVSVTGTGSSSAGNISAYSWTQVSGPTSATLSGQTTATLTASALSQGSYTFRLKVTDVKNNTSTDDVIVTVNPAPVTIQANAGADKSTTLPANSISITGSGSSSAGSISAYSWTQVSGPTTATLSAQTTTTLTAAALVKGTYTFQLKVTDINGNTATDNVTVTVNAAPVTISANAGADKVITLPIAILAITGSGSSSAGSISSYAWSKISGPTTVTLSTTNTATLNLAALGQGTYIFELKVTDVAGNSAVDDVTVTVNPLVITNNLVAEWNLDNNIGDISGNNNNGTMVGSPAFASDNEQGTASMTFSGSGQYITVDPNKLPSGTSARSISLWAKTTSTATGYRWAFSYGKSLKSGAMFIGMNGTTLFAGGFQDDLSSAAGFWTTNVWHHLCLTYDGSTAVLYADGTAIASGAKNWNISLDNSGSYKTTASIGRQVNGAEFWNGNVDDVRVYNKALSITEVKALAAAGTQQPVTTTPPPTSSLVGEWKLDNDMTDVSGNAINGTSANPKYTTDHKEGTAAMTFNGTDQYVDLKNSNANFSKLPAGKSPRSMSLWAKVNDTTSTKYRWAAAYGSPYASQAMFIGQYGSALYGGGFTDDLVKKHFWDYNWHHICLTYDGTTAVLYADGKQVVSGSKNWNLVLASAYIGRQVNFAEYWNGSVDDVRIYNKALSAAEVATLASTATATSSSSASQVLSVESSLAGEWSFDNNTTDKSGNMHDGTLTGGAWYDARHQEGTASLSLNGNGQYVDLKNPSNLPAAKSARSISVWARTADVTSAGYRWTVAYGTPAQSQAMFIGQKANSLYAGGFMDDLVVDNFWKADEWHHLCLTYDGTTATLYADGKYLTSAAKTWNLKLANAFVGRQVNGAEYWTGSIDDVRIYSKALSAAEVASIFQSNSAIARTAVEIKTVDADSVQTQPVVSGEDGTGNNFTIYPNPAQRSISLNINPDVLNEGDAATMIIHDMTGKLVKRVDGLTQDSLPTDIDELTDGLYVATIVVHGATVDRQRFIKTTR